MQVTITIGVATVAVEAPQGEEGRALVARLRAAMVAAGAVDKVITQGPAIPERLYASPAVGVTTEELGERVRRWCRRAGCEVG